jgi:Ca-activated chloride channel family protein
MLKAVGGLIISLLVASAVIPAQNVQRPSQPPEREQIRLGSIGVNLPVTVLDKKGRLVTDLALDNFQLYEDGEEQKILSLSKENELPLNVGVLMDASNSVRPKLKFAKDASMNFFDTVIRRGKDLGLFVVFNSKVELLQDFTDNLEDLRDAIFSVKAGGPTALDDAIYRVCEEKLPTTAGRRAIIVISDGEDTASRHTLEEAIEMAQKTEAGIYCIGTTNAGPFGVYRGSGAPGDKELVRLAEETGGKAFFPTELLELDKIFADIGSELRGQYVLFYVSSNQARDGKFRKLEVKIVGRDGLRIRVKRGFSAPLGESLL